MKFKASCTCLIAIFIILISCAFTIDEDSSIKELTHPYMNTYECTRATLGDTNLLEDYDYFRIIIGEKNQLKIMYRKKDGSCNEFDSTYKFNEKTNELTAEIGIMGFNYKQKTIITDGRFTITMPIMSKQLVMIFEVL